MLTHYRKTTAVIRFPASQVYSKKDNAHARAQLELNAASEEGLNRKENNSQPVSVAPPIVYDALNSSGGRGMDADTRAFMERRFHYDFGDVKIHDDGVAAKSASSINEIAYTSGNSIVFNSGQYNTSSDTGKRLLAHELTHVVQQNGGMNGIAGENTIQRQEDTDDHSSTLDERKEQDCSGWESDPQSFCIKVADNFRITEFGNTVSATSVTVADDGGCRVMYEDGVVITVQKMGNQKVFVEVSPFSTKKIGSRVRCYVYTCSTSGQLNLVRTNCS